MSLQIVCGGEIIPQPIEKFLITIGTIKGELASITSKQQEIAIALHSRSAPLEKIHNDHAHWSEQLTVLSNKIKTCQTLIQQQSEQLPFLVDRDVKIKEWVQITDFEQTRYRTKIKNKELTLLLNSKEHREALSFYKEIIQECEKDQKKATELMKVAEIKISAQEEAIKYVDPALKSAICSLHQEIRDFLMYAKGIREVPEGDESITTFLIIEAHKKYFATFKTVTLENDRYFKNGIYFANWRYPTIYPAIQLMQEVAKGLQKIETDLERDSKTAWQKPFALSVKTDKKACYEACLSELKKNLICHKKSLYKISFCAEVHAGLHYAASLSVWASEIERSLAFFDQITEEPWRSMSAVQSCLVKTLQCKPAKKTSSFSDSSESINALHQTICCLESLKPHAGDSFLIKYQQRIIPRVIETLALLGKPLLPLSVAERKLETNILIGKNLTPFKRSLDAENGVDSFVKKKYIQLCYYYPQKRADFDLPLDLFLTALSTHEVHKYLYEWMMLPPAPTPPDSERKEVSLYEIVLPYSKATSLEADKAMLSQLVDVQKLLIDIENFREKSHRSLYHFVLYAHSQQILFDAKKKANHTISVDRFKLFLSTNSKKIGDFKTEFEFPDYCNRLEEISIPQDINQVSKKLEQFEPMMYKLLLHALWAENQAERVGARKSIDYLIENNPSCNFLNHHLVYLLKELALTAFSPSGENSLTTKTYLPRFLAKYIESLIDHMEYVPEIIEKVLYTVLSKESCRDMAVNDDLQAALAKHRNSQFFTDWQEIMTSYVNKTATKEAFKQFETTHSKELESNYYYGDLHEKLVKKLTQLK
jgi:hypothetical protein